MTQYISKSALVAEINRILSAFENSDEPVDRLRASILIRLLSFIDTLEVKDPYEQRIQYSSIEDGIKAHAETYSFNIESKLFNQLTKEQQKLWRKEIEQAVISGGEIGVELANDRRYKQKPEWSEEDEAMHNDCMCAINATNEVDYTDEEKQRLANWLKSLSPQSCWKPSKTEICVLEDIISGKAPPSNYQITLQYILEQLKKL